MELIQSIIEWFGNNLFWILPALFLVFAVIQIAMIGLPAAKKNTYRIKLRANTMSRIGSRNIILPNEEEYDEPDWSKEIQIELRRLKKGNILFNCPTSMKVGVTQRVEVRISKDKDAILIKNLKGSGDVVIDNIKVGDLMTVTLYDDDHFKILPLNHEAQLVPGTDYAEWSWDVTPKNSGLHVLYLRVTVRLRYSNGEEKRDYPVMDKEIKVEVNIKYSSIRFIKNSGKWIIESLIGIFK